MSEDALLLEIVRKEFQQVTGVVLIIVMDMGEEVVQPLADIDMRQLAASHKGVDDGSVFCSIMVALVKSNRDLSLSGFCYLIFPKHLKPSRHVSHGGLEFLNVVVVIN